MNLRATRLALIVLMMVSVAIAVDNFGRPLANPDEGRYSEISREMAQSGDWVTPRLNGIRYFEKPPLQYWATALSFRLFGDNEYAARLYVGLCGLVTIFLVGYTGRRLDSRETGVASMMALLSSPYFMAMGGIVTLDMGLTLWTTVTLCAYLIAGTSAERAERRRWMLLAWAGMALALLSKGLVGLVFPVIGLALHALMRRDWTFLRDLEWRWGLIVFIAIAAPWFVAVSLANPEFPEFFFIHEHFTRFLTNEHRRKEVWWYFLPILALGFLPWIFALPAAIGEAWRSESRAGGERPLTLAVIWAAFVLVFFSASGSKLPHYILPAFPPLALVLGRYLARAPTRRLMVWIAPLAASALALGWFAWDAPRAAGDDWVRAMYLEARPWGMAGAGVLLLVGVVTPILFARGLRWLGLVLVALGVVLFIDCVEDAYDSFTPRQSGIQVAQKMKPYLTPETRVYMVNHYDQTVPFYIKRTVRLADYVDEFEMGLSIEPWLYLHKREFPADWLRPGDALAIMQPGVVEKLRAQGLPVEVLYEDPRRVLVRKP